VLVLLVCGVLAYVGVMRELGTIDFVGNSVSSIGMPMLAALLLGYVGNRRGERQGAGPGRGAAEADVLRRPRGAAGAAAGVGDDRDADGNVRR
jgi:hypothetical protein